jgi:RNA recognition motif-containing protein
MWIVNIYVGNLSYEATQDDLRQAFEAHGEVSSVSIIMDRMTGRSRGFGFVEMPDQGAGQAAVTALNLQEVRGRAMTVNEAGAAAGARAGNDPLEHRERAPWKRGALSFADLLRTL